MDMIVKYDDEEVGNGPWETSFRKRYLKEGQMIKLDVRVDYNVPDNREKIFKCLYETHEEIEKGNYEVLDFEEENGHQQI